MKKRYFLLVGLLPLFYACGNKVDSAPIKYQNYPIINEEAEEDEACTVMYVGKNVSKNRKAIIARSSDAGPGAMMINTTIFERNALANQTVTSNKGFSYKMPSTTYRYISTPRNPIIHKGHHWEASAINEYGVGVSATLSCYYNEYAKAADPLIEGGISEDNIAQIAGATAKTAREGIEIIASIIDEQGAQDGNAIMTIDQNEAWYMEIYSGHQYAAVKMPDDKILTAGNEFVLDSLYHMNIELEDAILSDELLTKLADVDGEDRRKFDDDTKKDDVRHLNLAETYSVPLTDEEEGDKRVTNDGRHRRTWRGYSLFAETARSDCQTYNSTTKYDAFYTPDNDQLDIHDVTKFMRDRFEDILDDDPYVNPNTTPFRNDDQEHKLRYIGIETAYQIHIIQSDKSLPSDLAATEWLSMSNSNYTPFVPINCSIHQMSDYYTHVSSTYEYDEASAANIYKQLNTLARTDREHYGKPIEEFWNKNELIWESQYNQLIEQVKNLDARSRYEIMTNYITRTQDTAVKTAQFMIEDLMWFKMNYESSSGTLDRDFDPCINVKEYAISHGYSYQKNGKTIKFGKGEDQYTLVLVNEDFRPKAPDDPNPQSYRPLGEITYGDNKDKVDMAIRNQEVYMPYTTLVNYIKGDTIVINADDYRNSFNHAVWIVPTAVGVPIIIGSILSFASVKKRKKVKNK